MFVSGAISPTHRRARFLRVVALGFFSLTMRLLHVLVSSMYAEAQTPAPTPHPDPPRASAAMPAALGRILSLVRKLIDYGRQIASTVHQRAAAPGFARSPDPSAPPISPSSSPASPMACAAPRRWKPALPTRRPQPGPHANARPRARHRGPRPAPAVSTAGRPARAPARRPHRGPTPHPPAHGRRNRRRGATPTGRRRHRRYLP